MMGTALLRMLRESMRTRIILAIILTLSALGLIWKWRWEVCSIVMTITGPEIVFCPPSIIEEAIEATPLPTIDHGGNRNISTLLEKTAVTPNLSKQLTPTSYLRLLSPDGGSCVTLAQQTFQWQGQLPNSRYGYQVKLYHENDTGICDYEDSSWYLNESQWRYELRQIGGTWNWYVDIVNLDTQDIIQSSEKWTLYYTPFGCE